MLAGQRLGWLEGLVDDTPLAVWAESDGPGDDIRLELRDGAVAEVQAKKGLSTGDRLWEPLLSLAEAIHAEAITYGVLVVCPHSSATIRCDLAQDIARLGDGRSDGLKDLGLRFKEKIEAAGLTPSAVCGRLRIQTVYALDPDQPSVSAARAHLAQVCRDSRQAADAWSRLLLDAHAIIERRGRWDVLTAARLLSAYGIPIAEAGSPAAVISRLLPWTLECNGTFQISGAKTPLSIDARWIPLKALVLDSGQRLAELAPAEALDRYHGRERGAWKAREKAVDAELTGRFYRHCVVIGGPGLGKSTLLRKMAHLYADDSHPVLRVSLRAVAARMGQGASFTESVLALGLDGSGLSPAAFEFSGSADWVLLCDGLDEAQAHQELVAQALEAFRQGHPHIRIIVTTRPIGYETAALSQWRHYELLPLEESAAEAHLASLLAGLKDEAKDGQQWTAVSGALKACGATDVIRRSPHLMGMAALLLAHGRSLGETRTQLYQHLYNLLEQAPNPRRGAPAVAPSTLAHAASLMGWQVVEDPLRPINDVLDRCARQMAEDADVTLLRAAELMDQCVGHWEDTGLVERVRHAGQDYLTFTHLTFAEYAAARWLTSLPPARQRGKITEILTQPKWAEVVAFAGSQGAATMIFAVFLEQGQGDEALLARVLAVLAEPDCAVDESVLAQVLDLAWQVVRGPDDQSALKLGASLATLAERYPDHLAGPAEDCAGTGQHWSRLIGLLCAVRAGDALNLDDTVAAIEQLSDELGSGMYGSLMGGMIFDVENPSRVLLEQLALCWVDRALEHWDRERVSEAVHRSISDRPFTTTSFYTALQKRLGSAMIVPESMFRMTDLMIRLFGFTGAAEVKAGQDLILDAVIATCPTTGRGAASKSLIRLNGFLRQIGVCDAIAGDMFSWSVSDDVDAVREVLRIVIEASPFDGRVLAEEARKARELQTSDPVASLFQACGQAVDLPAPDPAVLGVIKVDWVKLGRALLHPSRALVKIAAHIARTSGRSTKEWLGDLIVQASGFNLAAIAYVAGGLPKGDFEDLVLERIENGGIHGTDYLFRSLSFEDLTWSDRLARILVATLHCPDVRVAEAGGKLMLGYAEAGVPVPAADLLSAFDHWQRHEEPYPVAGGAVPPSPRGDLLKALLAVQGVPYEWLMELAGDCRPEVRDAAMEALLQPLQDVVEVRAALVNGLVAKTAPPNLLIRALREKIPFSEIDVDQLAHLVASDDPALRLATCYLLDPHYLDPARLRSLARQLMEDEKPEIQRRARRRLIDAER